MLYNTLRVRRDIDPERRRGVSYEGEVSFVIRENHSAVTWIECCVNSSVIVPGKDQQGIKYDSIDGNDIWVARLFSHAVARHAAPMHFAYFKLHQHDISIRRMTSTYRHSGHMGCSLNQSDTQVQQNT